MGDLEPNFQKCEKPIGDGGTGFVYKVVKLNKFDVRLAHMLNKQNGGESSRSRRKSVET